MRERVRKSVHMPASRSYGGRTMSTFFLVAIRRRGEAHHS
jgi:hypothetical protein